MKVILERFWTKRDSFADQQLGKCFEEPTLTNLGVTWTQKGAPVDGGGGLNKARVDVSIVSEHDIQSSTPWSINSLGGRRGW